MEKVKPWLGEPQNTIAVLQKYGFVFQKKYGQNFLIAPADQKDIIVAYSKDVTKPSDNTLNLTFQHILTRINLL